MKRIILNLSLGVLTFFIGSAASMMRVLLIPDTPEAHFASVQGWFEPLIVIGGVDACGPEANFHTLDLSDGTRIETSCKRVASPAAARRVLENRLAGATEIIEREPNLDENGRRVGERVVAMAAKVIELETGDSYFCETEAASLKHLRWFHNR